MMAVSCGVTGAAIRLSGHSLGWQIPGALLSAGIAILLYIVHSFILHASL